VQSYVGHSTSRLFFIIISFVFTSNIFWLLISLNLQPNSIISLLQPGCSRCVCFCRDSPSGPGPPHSRGFYITYNDAPQSVGLLWTSDQPVAVTSTWKHTTLTTDRYPCARWDSNPQSQQASRQTYALDRAATGTGFVVGIRHINMKEGSAGTIAQYGETPASNYGVHPSIRLWRYSPFRALASLTRRLHSSSEAF